MSHRKPTGDIGPVGVRVGQEAVKFGWDRIRFTSAKDEIELFVVQKFIDAGLKAGFSFINVEQNKENHFDFTLVLPGGVVYMDLVELIYADEVGNPYTSNNITIMTRDYALQIYETIGKKSKKYSNSGSTPIHLLTYITHWRFLPSEAVIRLVQYMLRGKGMIFEIIFFLAPTNNDHADLRIFFPSLDENFVDFDASELDNHFYLNLNPAKFELVIRSESNNTK